MTSNQTTDQPDPIDAELGHTKITDEILDVIDTGDSNRYQVALRLTAYVEGRDRQLIRDARKDENDIGWHHQKYIAAGNESKYFLDRIAQLNQEEGKS